MNLSILSLAWTLQARRTGNQLRLSSGRASPK